MGTAQTPSNVIENPSASERSSSRWGCYYDFSKQAVEGVGLAGELGVALIYSGGM